MTPSDRKYTKSHQWVLVNGGVATIGITDHAQASMGDITYIELPEVGHPLDQGEECGVVESVKTASELLAPISGEVTAANEKLVLRPERINEDPYGAGWMFKMKGFHPRELDRLLDADEYESMIEDDEVTT